MFINLNYEISIEPKNSKAYTLTIKDHQEVGSIVLSKKQLKSYMYALQMLLDERNEISISVGNSRSADFIPYEPFVVVIKDQDFEREEEDITKTLVVRYDCVKFLIEEIKLVL